MTNDEAATRVHALISQMEAELVGLRKLFQQHQGSIVGQVVSLRLDSLTKDHEALCQVMVHRARLEVKVEP